MDAGAIERRLAKVLRILPGMILVLLALAYFFGGFSTSSDLSLLQKIFRWFFTLFIGVGPIIFIGFLFLINGLRNRSSKNRELSIKKLEYDDPFLLPAQEMHGFKIVFLTGRNPSFTGLTGDLYSADDVAICSLDSKHVPPVADCECGFYAYKDLKSALYELSINPGSFLVDVDLFGIGFSYTQGFRAESQLINHLTLPRRCMRCKTFPAKKFVTSYKVGFNSFAYWRWELRCGLCSFTYKDSDQMTPSEMSKALKVKLG